MKSALATCLVAVLDLATVTSGVTAGTSLTVPEGLTLTLRAPRLLALDGLIAVRFDNQTGDPVLVSSLAVHTGLFADEPTEEENVLVYDGQRVDIPVALGAAICPAADATATVETTIEVGGGSARTGDVAVDPAILLDLNARECDMRYITDQVDIAFADDYEDRGDSVEASLVFSRRAGSASVVVDQVRGSVNFVVTPLGPQPAHDAGPLASLAPGDESVTVPVSIVAARCEPHAMFESKRMFQFHVWVGVDDVAPQAVTVIPEGALRDLLQAQINACAAALIGASPASTASTMDEEGNGV